MSKKKQERTFETPQQEITFLRKQVAGLKGCNATIQKERDDLNNCVSKLLDEKKRYEKINNGLESQVQALGKEIGKLKFELVKKNEDYETVKANLDYYKSLPWYKRIFFK